MSSVAFWIALAAAAAGGLLSTLHMSLRDASRAKLQLIASRNGGLGRLKPVLDDVGPHALAISLPRVLLNLLVVVSMLVWLTGVGDGSRVAWADVAIAVLSSAALLYVIGVVIPTSVADHAGEHVVYQCAGLIRALYFVMLPFARLVQFVDVVVRRLVGAVEVSDAEEIERELMSVVTEGEQEGSLGEVEREMIEAIVELRSSTAQEIMTPRTEVEGFELTNDLNFIKAFIEKAGHSRIPVYKGDLDHIVGLLYAKDLLRYLGEDLSSFKLRPLLRKPQFVPETMPLLGLLKHFQQNKIHLAIVIDEYGGTAGVVTIEDLLEEIVGDIADEYEPETELPPRIDVRPEERAVEVDARAYIDDVNDELDELGFEIPEGEDYDTVGGFVLSELGHMPVSGEAFTRQGLTVRIIEAEPTRVTRVRIEFAPDDNGAAVQSGRDERRGAD